MNSITDKIIIESPSTDWKGYELIDSGDGYKLERFGDYILARPEPKALWSKDLSEAEWQRLADTTFIAGAGFGKAGKEESGTWKMRGRERMPDRWFLEYKGADRLAAEWSQKRHNISAANISSEKGLYFKLRLGLTSFKHVGVFPEQSPNWEWIYSHTRMLVNGAKLRSQMAGNAETEKVKVLNIFAYTGGASLAARCAGADVTHVDSVKQVVTWAKENQALSDLDNIRWIVDDALKFIKREIRRGNTYNGLIMDPPAYGHGPDGERWKLDELLFELLTECSKIVAPEHSFTVLNLYSNGYSALLADTLLKKAYGHIAADKKNNKMQKADTGNFTCGELVLKDSFGKAIPLSVFARMFNE